MKKLIVRIIYFFLYVLIVGEAIVRLLYLTPDIYTKTKYCK